METGLGDVHATALDLLDRVAPDRAQALRTDVTIDMDTTDVEVYGRLKQRVASNHQGQRVGRPHVATWADTATVLSSAVRTAMNSPGGEPGSTNELGIQHGHIVDANYGSGLSFRDPDNIALEFFAPPAA